MKAQSPNHWTTRTLTGAQFLEVEFKKPVTHASGTVPDVTGHVSLVSGV